MNGELYRMGEWAELAGVTRRTVHYYINKGLIPPAEGAGVNSYYTADHLNRIRLIRKMQESYLPLNEIRKIVTPLDPAQVVEHLELYKLGEPPANRRFVVQEMAHEESSQLPGTPLLYERVDLGSNIELHFPAGLREKNPALIRSLIENTGRIIRNLQNR